MKKTGRMLGKGDSRHTTAQVGIQECQRDHGMRKGGGGGRLQQFVQGLKSQAADWILSQMPRGWRLKQGSDILDSCSQQPPSVCCLRVDGREIREWRLNKPAGW